MEPESELSKRATIYLEPKLHKALKLKAAQMERTFSDLVNDAIRQSLAEDAIDLEALKKRKSQPERSFEAFVTSLRKDGHL